MNQTRSRTLAKYLPNRFVSTHSTGVDGFRVPKPAGLGSEVIDATVDAPYCLETMLYASCYIMNFVPASSLPSPRLAVSRACGKG